jgi:hypothetical protein
MRKTNPPVFGFFPESFVYLLVSCLYLILCGRPAAAPNLFL